MKNKIVIVAGGTGGHIYPGIALAQELKNNSEILFIGSNEGLEKELVSREGYEIKLIRARALLRKISYKAISAPFVSLIGFFQAYKLLKNFRPKAVISTGGYVSLPVVLAAKLLGIDIYLHEQNVLPGAVNRFCARFAKKVFLSFPESQKYLSGEVTGNPVRQGIAQAERQKARRKFDLEPNAKVVLVMGGSQGSKKINETVVSALHHVPKELKVLHLIGTRDFGWVKSYLEGKEVNNYQALPYLHDMSDALAAADLVISRAGATAIAEFLVRHLPMILIPVPYAAEDHQRLNARVIEEQGAALLVEDKDFTTEKFIHLITESGLNYDMMRSSAARLAKPDAAKAIAAQIYE